MKTRSALPIVLAMCVPAVAVFATACGSSPKPSENIQSTGSISLPLTTTTNGATYRLVNVSLFIEGPTFEFLNEFDPTETVLSTTLSTGSYEALLEQFTLEKDDGTGNFFPVVATLEQNFIPFTIFNGTTTTLVFRFQTDGVIVTVGSGSLDIGAAVDQTPTACTPLGSDCAAGLWCPPASLTGADVACISAGTVAVGQACAGPTDCVANASCFDSGSGPTCAALCPGSSFGLPCAGGGTCVAVGTDYGRCSTNPDGGAGADGGSLAACTGSPPASPVLLGAAGSPGGGTYSYAAPGLTPPTVTSVTQDGGAPAIHVVANPGVTSDPANAYSGFGVFFSSPACVDASAFTGVEFTVTGDLGTCSLTFSPSTSDDNAVSSGGPAAACTAAVCQTPFSSPLGIGTTVIHFGDLANGAPDPNVDAASLIGANWNLELPTDGVTAPCAADITVSDVSFISN